MKYETPKIISETSKEAPTAFIPVFLAIGAVFATALVATNTVLILAMGGAIGVAAAAGAVFFVASTDSC